MERMVYSPKAYAFTKDRNGIIRDLSPYIVSGEVRRVVNAVSSANIVLRNPEMIFTKPDANGLVTFMPMDPITIYLERLKGFPVRVFTGFLDTTPYLQLYPGTISLEASCTLKRLQYTYFDPALPYTQSFLGYYGWTDPKAQGSVFNLNGLNDWAKGASADAIGKYGDGSIAELLAATLIYIGLWEDNALYIEKLPEDLFEMIATLQAQKNDANKAFLDEFNAFLKKIIGAGTYGSRDGSTTTDDSAGTGGGDNITGSIKGEKKVAQAIMKSADKWGVPAWFPLTVCIHETHLQDLTQSPGQPLGSTNHGGYFQWDSENGPPGSYSGAGVKRSHPHGAHDAGFSSDLFCEAAKRTHKKTGIPYGRELAEKVQGAFGQFEKWDPFRKEADAMVSKYGIASNVPGAGETLSRSSYMEVPSATENDSSIVLTRARASDSNGAKTTTNSTPGGPSSSTEVFNPMPRATGPTTPQGYFGNDRGDHIHAGIDVPMPVGSPCIAPVNGKIGKFAGNGDFDGGSMVHFIFTHDVGGIKAGTRIGWGHISSCSVKPGETVHAGQTIARSGKSNNGFPHVHFIARMDDNAMDGSRDPQPIFNALKKGGKDAGGGGGDVEIKITYNYTNMLPDKRARSGKPYQIVLHSTEGDNAPGLSDLKGLGSVLKAQGFSVHIGIDGEGNIARYVKDSDVAFHVLGQNAHTLGIEQVGHAAQTSWPKEQTDAAAKMIAYWANKYDIPIKKIDPHKDINAKGVLRHMDFAGISGNDHTDPGEGYPFDEVLDKAIEYAKSSVGDEPGDPGAASGDSGADPSVANAFAVAFNFPTVADSLEATGLTGNKSLMNDQPLLPFIQQLCEASLRQFQSLPDGRFYAFFADYFGEMMHHPPYWEIDDIEVLNGGINLSDDALVTHMYVVGDTTFPNANDMINRVTTSGVVTVFDAFLTGAITGVANIDPDQPPTTNKEADEKTGDKPADTAPKGMNMIMRQDEAAAFLNRFGGRPAVEPLSMIKSHFFEFFVAYQRFLLAWSRQFISTFEFTFMPEIYPGGKVGFKDHGLQMYVEDVTHSWNYETGFITTANLSAPSVYAGNPKGLPPNMVRAIVSNVGPPPDAGPAVNGDDPGFKPLQPSWGS